MEIDGVYRLRRQQFKQRSTVNSLLWLKPVCLKHKHNRLQVKKQLFLGFVNNHITYSARSLSMEEKRSIWIVIGPLIGVVLLYFAISAVVDFYRAGIIQIEIDELVAKHVENVTQQPAAPVEEAPAVAPGETAALTETVTLTVTSPITETTVLTESLSLTGTTPITESALLTETAPLTGTTPITETTP